MQYSTINRAVILLAFAVLIASATARATELPPPAKPIANSVGMKLVLIPSGDFQMGSAESATEIAAFFRKALQKDKIEVEPFQDEHPQHHVRITRPFYLGACHVARGQFRKFVEDTNYKTEAEFGGLPPGASGWNANEKRIVFDKEYNWRNVGFEQTDDHPVLCVSWHDAVLFCHWLSRKEGRTYRLPTEAEWEYACRAGTTTRFSCGDDPESLARYGNLADASVKAVFPALQGTLKANDGSIFTSPVGSFRPNAFGLYDMHGNAEDWCADWYGKDYYAISPATDPRGPDTGIERVARGSPWCGLAYSARSAMRFHGNPGLSRADKGFRVVMVADGAVPKSAGWRFDGRVAVSAETTRVLGPLDKEGHVDFLAALNERCRQGVTAENNAAVPFWQALGPSWAAGFEEKFFHTMGIDPPPRKGKYLLQLKYYVSSRQNSLPVKRINADYAWDVCAPHSRGSGRLKNFPCWRN